MAAMVSVVAECAGVHQHGGGDAGPRGDAVDSTGGLRERGDRFARLAGSAAAALRQQTRELAPMPQMTGGQALVAGMRQAGVTTLFGIPGVHNGGLYDALLDAPDMRVVITRHEQGAAFMADGYARASGRVACVATITGPGITNAATGLGEAYAESSPVLHIATALGPASRTAGSRRVARAPGPVGCAAGPGGTPRVGGERCRRFQAR